MKLFNGYGLLFMAIIMIPNILFALTHKDAFGNAYRNKAVETVEQIGRFGCFGFMVINPPALCLGWRSDEALTVYLVLDALLIALYLAAWAVCRHKSSVFRSLALSILPSVLFLFSAITVRSLPLLLSALLFAPAHILISYKNARAAA